MERFDPATSDGRIAYEHLHRYAICRDRAGGRRVLDLACGTGYGTFLLSQITAEITGVDIDAGAVATASRRYRRPNLRYIAGDAYSLPFADASFDLVVANEIIEHIDDHEAFIQEAKRVLAPSGVLMISTPNKSVYNRFKAPNPFHVSELELDEFRELLEGQFAQVELTGLRLALVSAAFDLSPARRPANNASAKTYLQVPFKGKARPDVGNEELCLSDPEYVLAVCSDGPIDETASPSSIFVSPTNDIWLEHEKILAWASQLHEEDEKLRQELRQTQEELEKKAAESAETVVMRTGIELSSRLLGKLTGREVHADVGSTSEALFELHEQLIRQSTEVEQLAELRQREVRLTEQIGLLRTDLEQFRNGLTQTLQEKASLEISLGAQTAELEKMRIEASGLAQNVSHLRTNLTDAKAEHDRVLMQAEEKAAVLEKKIASFQVESATAGLEAETRSTELLQRIGTLTAELATAQAQAEHRNSEHEERISLLTAELATAEAQAENQNSEHEQQIASLTAELATAQAQAESRNSELEQRIALHASEVETAQVQVTAAAGEKVSLAKSLEAERRIRLGERQEGSGEIERLKREVQALTISLSELQAASAKADDPPSSSAADASSARLANAAGHLRKRLARVQRHARLELGSAQGIGQTAPIVDALAKKNRLLGKLSSDPYNLGRLFDPSYVRAQTGAKRKIKVREFITDPVYFGVNPIPLFQASDYLWDNPDVAQAGVSPLLHYAEHGWREGRSPHRYFANDWYLKQNPDVLQRGLNPLRHYLEYGWREGRKPNPAFDPEAYLSQHPDVREAGIEPLTHLISYGLAEDRDIACQGLGHNWREAGQGQSFDNLLDLLLFGPLIEGEDTAVFANTEETAWPPEPLNDFWLPQTMRDFLCESHRESEIPLYQYLYSVMAAYVDRQGDFADSESCATLLSRVTELAQARARGDGERPKVSVIVPIYNNLLDTLLCITCLLEQAGQISFEIVIADDASTDASAELWGSVGGNVRHLRHGQNLGFLGNCNAAAERAQGTIIVLLNNDTLVLPDWLDHLVQPFETHERVGLVGSKLINWDGTLQEAGGIFWNDGSAWNFGRGGHALDPEFNYLKDVDYCSGASIAVPAAIWQEMGGFDPIFSPAYCEDSDLAFRLREAGYRTLYQPQSEVVHHEGRSHGREVTSGIKAYQVTNQQRLLERWRNVLAKEHFPNAHEVLKARDRSAKRRHVLVIDHYVPKVDQDAGSRTIFSYLKVLTDNGCSVTFWPENLHNDPLYTSLLQQMGVEVIYGPSFVNEFQSFMRARSGLYDAILMSRPHISVKFIDVLERESSAVRVYYGHDIHFERMAAQRVVYPESVSDTDIGKMRELELEVINRSNVVLYPSHDEAQKIKALASASVSVSAIPPYCFTEAELEQASASIAARANQLSNKLSVLFVGGFAHSPNVDGLRWFVNEVAPKLRAADVVFDLKVVGSKAGPEVYALQQPGIEILGFVSDTQLTELYAACSLVIAPLRYGAGVKGKVIEAMARGAPVVTTTVGAQGIPGANDMLFVGDDVASFSSAFQAAADAGEGSRKARAALRFIKQDYSQASIARVLLGAIDSSVKGR